MMPIMYGDDDLGGSFSRDWGSNERLCTHDGLLGLYYSRARRCGPRCKTKRSSDRVGIDLFEVARVIR